MSALQGRRQSSENDSCELKKMLSIVRDGEKLLIQTWRPAALQRLIAECIRGNESFCVRFRNMKFESLQNASDCLRDPGAKSLAYFSLVLPYQNFICVRGNQSLDLIIKTNLWINGQCSWLSRGLKRLLIWPFQLQVPVNLHTTPFWNRLLHSDFSPHSKLYPLSHHLHSYAILTRSTAWYPHRVSMLRSSGSCLDAYCGRRVGQLHQNFVGCREHARADESLLGVRWELRCASRALSY